MTEETHQARGQIANENRITSDNFLKIPCCERLYFQPMPHGNSNRKTTCAETFCGKLYLTMLAGLTALSHLAFCPPWSSS